MAVIAANLGKRIFVLYWLPVYLYMGLIFYLSGQTHPPVPSIFFRLDKLVHLLEYAVLGLLLIRALNKQYGQARLSALKCVALTTAVLYAASDEWHQMLVIGRYPDALDWLVDSLGSAGGAFLILTSKNRNKF